MMAIGLEELLKELRADENITGLEFNLLDIDRSNYFHDTTFHFVIHTIRKSAGSLKFNWTLDKDPEDFTPMLNYIKKEIKNQLKD